MKLLIFLILCAFPTNPIFAQETRPQEPIAPFPYRSEDVLIENKTDNISLAGTLTMPSHGSGFPVVLLLSGSGPQNRDSELLGHKPFLVLADHLTKNGIAVLRIDDRGTGGSTGIYNETGIAGFKRDAEAAISYLKTRREIDKSGIGVLGHSLGGAIAQLLAAESKDVAFVILMASPGLDGVPLMLMQKETIERKMGVPEVQIAIGRKQVEGAYEIISKSNTNDTVLKEALVNYFTVTFGKALPQSQVDKMTAQLMLPWFSDLIRYKPAPVLGKIKCPVLALNGANDSQVSPENLKAIEDNLRAAGNTNIVITELPKLNHLFQESETGLPNEYSKIDQTISPLALTAITNFVKEISKK